MPDYELQESENLSVIAIQNDGLEFLDKRLVGVGEFIRRTVQSINVSLPQNVSLSVGDDKAETTGNLVVLNRPKNEVPRGRAERWR